MWVKWKVVSIGIILFVLGISVCRPALATSTYSISNINFINTGSSRETGTLTIDFPYLYKPGYVFLSLPNTPSGFGFQPVGFYLPASVGSTANAIGGLTVSSAGSNRLKVEITSVAHSGNPARIILGHAAVMGGGFDGGSILIDVPGGVRGDVNLSITAPSDSEFSSNGVTVVNIGGDVTAPEPQPVETTPTPTVPQQPQVEAPGVEIKLTVGEPGATINGQGYTMDAYPYLNKETDRVMVPIRFIGEAFKAKILWSADKSQVEIRDGDRVVTLTVGSKDVMVNGTQSSIDSAPELMPPGRMFVPLRFVSETLGASVDYNPATNQITVVRK